MAEQNRDTDGMTSLSDHESTSDESDSSLVTVHSLAPRTLRKRKRHSKSGEKPAAKQSREETGKESKEVGTHSDTGASNADNEVIRLLTSETEVEQTNKTPANNPSM